MIVKIVSWNVNGIRAIHKKGFVDYLNIEKPDILCLQEVRATPEQIQTDNLKHEYVHQEYFPCRTKKGYSGVATFSTFKPKQIIRGIGIETFDQEGRILQTEYENFILLNIYFPNGKKDAIRLEYKLAFYDAITSHCNNLILQKKNVIICGDFNTAHTEIDLARPAQNKQTSGFLASERLCIDTLLSIGFVDVFREKVPEGNHYTWWSQQQQSRQRNIGWRIDYFLVSKSLLPSISRCYNQTDVLGSDHCPTILELVL